MSGTFQPAYQPAYVGVGSIIIDDIVYPDGQTSMGVLGGGISHAAAGMLIWDQCPGIMACAGRDLPAKALARLERDFDIQGLIQLDQSQARAWQLFEWDGKRTEIFRVDDVEPFIHAPQPDQVPDSYRGARGVYLLRGARSLPAWRALYPAATLLWEPFQQYMVPANAVEFRAALQQVDIVSPNLLEARQVYNLDNPTALVNAMLDDGAQIVALRMGEAGSLVACQANRRTGRRIIAVPAVPVPEIVDQTGAGNTYCGAFLVGWLETGDLVTAAVYGAVAASFALEVTGVADPPANLAEVREERCQWLRARMAGRMNRSY
ncbi:MAG: hypothetical protein JXQ72_01445 [Anaerolineae bacterium]|nr:hypothetical protein [Anaerolineae bacterium]